MGLFQKIKNDLSLFAKNAAGRGDLFTKVKTLARKGDNSIGRIGNFLINTTKSLGVLKPISATLQSGVNAIHNARVNGINNLERAIKEPISEIHNQNVYA
jgi:hypothetical protein